MEKITKKVQLLSVLVMLLVAGSVKAQFLAFTVNNGINYQCSNGGTNSALISVTSVPPGTTSYSWSVISSPCGITYTAAVPNGSIINMTFPCAGMYSISCVSMNGSSTTGFQFSQFFIYANPTITVSGASAPVCAGSTSTLSATGAISYTWSVGATGSQIIITPTVASCYSVSGTNTQGCTSTAVACLTLQTANLLISPASQTVCRYSSANLIASGAVSTYTWNTNATTNSINVSPFNTTPYTVWGTGSNGCIGMGFATVVVDTTCSDVWPGDANNDGVVTTADVFEIGLAFSSTGSARTPGGNSYTGQHANNWLGTVSGGKNKCHADCNGDGTVNMSDTVAIHNNFALTHSFKSSENSSSDPDISIVASQNTAFTGQWNKADIILGSSSNPMSQAYGVAFDLSIDPTFVEANSYYIVYTPSFLNQNNQNVQFRKPDFTTNKLYAATVRTDHANVNGNGKIAEIWFKVKNDAPDNSYINIVLSNTRKINNTGANAILTTGDGAIEVSSNATGVKENINLSLGVSVFPNPAKEIVYLRSQSTSAVNYIVTDLLGKIILKGAFTKTSSLNTSELSAGSYIVQFNSGAVNTYKKLVIEK